MSSNGDERKDFVPVIRMDSVDLEATAKTLRSACIDVGFFYLEGHGLSEELLTKVMNQSRALFNLPAASKKVLNDPVMSRGYTAMEEETLDPKRQIKGDTKEGFYIGVEIPKDDPRYDPSKLKGPNCWPTPEATGGDMSAVACKEFRSVMEEYHEKMSDLAFRVTRLLAKALDLNEHFLDEYFQDPTRSIRLLHYAKEASAPETGVFACGAHSDYGMITLLLTDDQPGLQINFRGDWIDVPPRPNAFIVNLGDMLERWSNGLFRSTLHRVLTSGEAERYSIPFFYEPDFEATVSCLPSCCSEENPPKFSPVLAGEYLKNKYRETHADFEPNKN